MESFQEVIDRREKKPQTGPKPKRSGRGGNRGGNREAGTTSYRPKTATGAKAEASDVDMSDVTAEQQVPVKQEQRVTRRQGGAGQAHPEGKEEEKKRTPHVRKNKSHIPSEEPGFTGEPSEWFDDITFKKQLIQDLTYNDEKHDYYFGSYSHFYIHEEMLKDKIRTDAYRHAIEGNKDDFKDKIVLDIGAGTGILSIFAARAGAKHVYAVENAEIAFFAREIIKQNGLESKITVLKGKMEDLVLPVPEVDIIISEWMGYFLLYESMLDSVLWARDKYLNKKTGKMLPDRAQIYIAGMEDEQYKHNKQRFWKNQYDVDMSIMTNVALKEPCIDFLNAYEDQTQYESIVTNSVKIVDLDLVHMQKGDVNFATQYKLEAHSNQKISAIIGWFDCHFENLKRKVVLSTSPFAPYTHWKNTIFYLDKPQIVQAGDSLSGSVAVKQSKENYRELDVKFSFHFKTKNGPQIPAQTQLYKVR